MSILIIALGILVLVNERLNELLINPIIDLLNDKLPGQFDWKKLVIYTSFISGFILAWVFISPLTDFVAETSGEESVVISQTITAFLALLVAGGSQLLHEVWGALSGIKSIKPTTYDLTK